MEQSVAASVPCVLATQTSGGQQVIVTQVQPAQEQVQTGAVPTTASFQSPTSVEGATLDAHIQEGVSSIPAVQQAIYQSENSGNVTGQALSDQFQGQLPTSYFSTTSIEGLVEGNSSPVNISPTSYDCVTRKLDSLFSNELSQMQNITDEHWKVQEFPLARIKKIMRMDEDVRMISAEVPVMLSKALELFITELSLRAWLQTEDSKRRTVQRSDIAMAITKNDMFDFLIDIVPREEIQLRSKTQKSADTGGGAGESLQLLPPELLQMCIQQLTQQALSTSAEEGGLMEDESGIAGSDGSDSSTSAGLLQQQLQLLQQLMQIQQQQEQQLEQTSPGLGETIQLQHPLLLNQTQASNTSTQASGIGSMASLDTQVLYSSVSAGSTTAAAAAAGGGIQFSTALEQLTGTGNQTILSIQPDQHGISSVSSTGVSFTNGSQHTLHHVDPESMAFHPHQPHELLQQPGSQSATVIIQSPLMDDVSSSNQTPDSTVTTLLDSGQTHFHHHPQQLQHMSLADQTQQLVTSDGQVAANLQHHLVHHVLVDPSSLDQTSAGGHFQLTDGGGVASSVMQTVSASQSTAAVSIDGGVEFGSDSSLSLHDGLQSTTDTSFSS